MAEIGLIKGLAVNTGLDQAINDLYRADEMNRRAQAIAEAKTKMFADDMEFNNAMNPHDNPIIKEYAKKTISEIGRFVNENPDWATNVNKRMWINAKKRELKDNPELMRGVASDNAFKQLNNDLAELAKNPEFKDTEAYDNLLMQRDNYLRFGNQDGEEALKAEGKKAFTYQKPRDFVNFTQTMLDSGSKINPSVVKKGRAPGEFWRLADPTHVDAVKKSLWQEHGRQIQVEARKLGLNTPEQIDKWLTDGIMAGVKTAYSPGDPLAAWELGMKERELALRKQALDQKTKPVSNPITPWDDLNDPNKRTGFVPPDVALKTFGDTPEIKIVGNTGKQADLTGYPVKYTNKYITDGNDVRRIVAFTDIPLDVAEKVGIYSPKSTSISFSQLNPLGAELAKGLFPGEDEMQGRPKGISAEYIGKAVMGQDKDGNKIVRVTTTVPIDPKNGTLREFYNTHAGPARLVQPLEESDVSGGVQYQQPSQSASNVPSASVSEWKKAGWSDAQIQQAVKLGKIKAY